MASRSAPNLQRTIRGCWCWTANSKPNRSTRCFWSRNPASPGTTRVASTLELVLGVQSPRGRGVDRVSVWAKPRAPSSQRESTRISPMSAAASADATIPRFLSTSRWRRCSFPAARCASPMIAISSSRAASSGTPSRCTRGSGSIGPAARYRLRRRPRSGWRRPQQFLAQRSDRRPRCRDRHLRRSESRRYHGSTPLARRDRGLDARLWNAADDDGAGGIGR